MRADLEVILAERNRVPVLVEADAVHLAELARGGLVVRLGLEDDELAALLRLEDLQGGRLEPGGDDAVGNLHINVMRGGRQ